MRGMRTLLLIALFASGARAAMPERIGLYPISLPEGQAALQESLAAQLHEGAADLPGVKAFDLVAHSACAPDEGECLGAAARRAGVEAMVSAAIEATAQGYRWHLRAFALEGKVLAEEKGEIQGGPLDLGGALELGVCSLLGAAPCLGEIRIASDAGVASAHVFVDGEDRGALPIEKPISAAVGRHAVAVGQSDEKRVRVSYGRTARLVCSLRAGAPALLDEADLAAPAAAPADQITLAEARTRAAQILVAAGAGLLAAAAGAELYTHLGSQPVAGGSRSGALTQTNSGVRRTGILATALAFTGAGAIAAGGLVFALTPSGAALQGRF